uniref:Fibroin light chain n=1 Tax=Limnephilus decipiens TaxID=329909 RepID=A5A6G8_9NEOP|nr:fibroin light chain [Limnephilus decipiens]
MALSLLIGALLAIQGASFVASSHISASLLEGTWDLVEQGEVEPYVLLLKDEVVSTGGVYGLGATLTGVGELAWPRPASGCGHSKLINANVALNDGTLAWGELEDAVDSYAVVLAQAVDNLRILGLNCIIPAPWPTLENSCGDWGRIYDFESSWSLSKVNKGVVCAARRLYTSFGARANNVGAAATSAATDAATSIISEIEDELVSYLEAVVSKSAGPKQKLLRTLAGSLKASIFRASGNAKSGLRSRCH